MLKSKLKYLGITIEISLSYWFLSHLNWIVFNKLGVTPMPIWPAASVALLSALHFRWKAIPGLIIGTVLANHISLGAPLELALGISIMNSAAPVAGAIFITKYMTIPVDIENIQKPSLIILIGILLIPLCTAVGGIGSKILLGLIKKAMIPEAIVQWTMAHMIGTILLSIPYLTWFSRINENTKSKGTFLIRTSSGRHFFVTTLSITVSIWTIISLFKLFWFPSKARTILEALFPANDNLDLMIRLVIVSILFLGGGLIAKFYISISNSKDQIKEQSIRIHTTLNSISDGVISTDTDGRITGMNSTAEEITGYSQKNKLGKKIETIFNTSSKTRLIRILENIKNDNAERKRSIIEIILPDNTRTILEISGSIITRDTGQKDGYLITFRDITEKITTEKNLKKNEEKLSTLFTSMSEMVVIHELLLNEVGTPVNYRIIDCNRTFTDITGINKTDAIGMLGTDLYQSTPPPYLDEFSKTAITGKGYEFSTFYSPMDKHFLISVVPMGKNRFATVTTDITAIHKTQEIIQEKNKELENYLYVASHDLRSPLVNIQGFSQRVQKQTEDIRDTISELNPKTDIQKKIDTLTNIDIPKSLDFIFSNVKKMDTLIKGLLVISRTGRIKMEIKKVDMKTIIKNTLNNLTYELESQGADIQIGELPDCYGDQNLLSQLFSNLISNALKYSSPDTKLKINISGKKTNSRHANIRFKITE